jgi:undecaprenyl-diphosphatase
MLEQELQWERSWFFLLNGSDSPFWDSFFYFYSCKWTWIPFYLCLLFIFIYRKNRTEIKRDWKEILYTTLSIILVIALCDQIASGIFKPLFHRLRPTHHPDFQDLVDIVFNQRGGKYGFISSHAANAFGLAVFTALLFKNRLSTLTMLLFALLTAYSRIYLGLHFISDVVAGALVGTLTGYAVYQIYRRKVKAVPCPQWKINLLCATYVGSIVILCLFLQFFHHNSCTVS